MKRITALFPMLLFLVSAPGWSQCAQRHFYNQSRTSWTYTITANGGSCSLDKYTGNVCTAAPGQTMDLHYPLTSADAEMRIRISSAFDQVSQDFNVITFSDCYIDHSGDTGRVYLNETAHGDVKTCIGACGFYIAPLLSALPPGGIYSNLICTLNDARSASACIARARSTRRDQFTIPLVLYNSQGIPASGIGVGTNYSNASLSSMSIPASANLTNCQNINNLTIKCTYGRDVSLTMTATASGSPSFQVNFAFAGYPPEGSSDVETGPIPLVFQIPGLDAAFPSTIYQSTVYVTVFPQGSNMTPVWGPTSQDAQ